MKLFAVKHVRRMNGGSQSHLMRCSDDRYYVVKFQNNPQGVRCLASDLFGSLLAKRMGLPVREPKVIFVDETLIKSSDKMTVRLQTTSIPCKAGLSFGSRYAIDHPLDENSESQIIHDFLMPNQLRRVKNIADFVGMLAFDKWTGNTDTRQAIFLRDIQTATWTASMIDQGHCFDGQSWGFSARPHQGIYPTSIVYENVTGIEEFEPWLFRIEHCIDEMAVNQMASEIPPEWYDGKSDALNRLIEEVNKRRPIVRDLLWETWRKERVAFPSWMDRRRSETSLRRTESRTIALGNGL